MGYEWREFPFAEVNTQYVRLFMLDAYGYRRLDLYGKPSASQPKYMIIDQLDQYCVLPNPLQVSQAVGCSPTVSKTSSGSCLKLNWKKDIAPKTWPNRTVLFWQIVFFISWWEVWILWSRTHN